MNLYAYHPTDTLKSLVHIDNWVVQYGRYAEGCCRICDQLMSVKGANSQRQTHFSHHPDSGCPTVVENHKPFAKFRQMPRDAQGADVAKEFAFKNIESIYHLMKKLSPGLTWKEMHELLNSANEEDIWSLKDMPHEYIPYVLLCCTEKHKSNGFGRKKDVFYVLEPSPTPGEYWNFPKDYKRYLWEVTLPGREVSHHEIELKLPEPWYMKKVRELLGMTR